MDPVRGRCFQFFVSEKTSRELSNEIHNLGCLGDLLGMTGVPSKKR